MAAPVAAQHHVIDNVHVADQSHAETVLRHKRQPHTQLADLQRRPAAQLFVAAGLGIVVEDAAGRNRLQTGDRLQKLALPRSGDTGNAENLARAGGEGHIVEHLHALVAHAGQPAHDQPVLRILRLGAGDVQIHLLANHHLGQLRLVRLGGVDRADIFALAQHGNTVGQRQHLVQLVGDDQNRLAVVAHTAQHGKQLLRLLRRQHGGRLVQDQDIRTAVEHLDDLDRLLFGDGHLIDLFAGVNVKAVAGGNGADLLLGGLAVKAPLPFESQHNIFRGGKHVHQLEMLVDHADPVSKRVARRADDHLFPVNKDLSLIREVDAGDHVHQRGFSAAVLS